MGPKSCSMARWGIFTRCHPSEEDIFSKTPYILQSKMEYTQKEFVDINTIQKGRKRIKLNDAALIPSALHPAYSSSVKLSSSKYNDLIKLIDDEIVPERYREIYKKNSTLSIFGKFLFSRRGNPIRIQFFHICKALDFFTPEKW